MKWIDVIVDKIKCNQLRLMRAIKYAIAGFLLLLALVVVGDMLVFVGEGVKDISIWIHDNKVMGIVLACVLVGVAFVGFYLGERMQVPDSVEVIARALVSKPDEVNVTEEIDGKNIVVKLRVADEDIGKIIGKSGRIAKALRTVVKAAAIKQNLRVTVEIVED